VHIYLGKVLLEQVAVHLSDFLATTAHKMSQTEARWSLSKHTPVLKNAVGRPSVNQRAHDAYNDHDHFVEHYDI